MTYEQKRILDDMLSRRIESSGEIEAEAIEQILAFISDLPDDAPMMASNKPGAATMDARTIRVWASFYRTPLIEN
jgi:hypothetical protein